MKDHNKNRDNSTRDSYIVRIYRRNRDNPQKIAGIVETVLPGKEEAFKSAKELMAILTRPIRKMRLGRHSKRGE